MKLNLNIIPIIAKIQSKQMPIQRAHEVYLFLYAVNHPLN